MTFERRRSPKPASAALAVAAGVVPPMERNLYFIGAPSDRVPPIQRGRIVRELPAAGLEDPALEHEFIG